MSEFTSSFLEPPPLEVKLTLGLGKTLLNPYYRYFAKSLNLHGNEQVLDFGSGSGICSRHIAELLKRGGHLDCVDISHVWYQVIQKTLKNFNNVNFYLGHLGQLHLTENAYDLIVIHFVLHDIPCELRSGIIKRISSLIKPGGRLIIREPQNHGLALDEIVKYTNNSQLNLLNGSKNTICFLRVYDIILQKRNGQSH